MSDGNHMYPLQTLLQGKTLNKVLLNCFLFCLWWKGWEGRDAVAGMETAVVGAVGEGWRQLLTAHPERRRLKECLGDGTDWALDTTALQTNLACNLRKPEGTWIASCCGELISKMKALRMRVFLAHRLMEFGRCLRLLPLKQINMKFHS